MSKEGLINLSEWTDEYLKIMEKSIKKELSNRSYKSKCCIEDGICDLNVWKRLKNCGMSESDLWPAKTMLQKALYKICDLTLGNYKVHEQATKSGHKLECSGSKLYDGIYDNYVKMIKEIMDVVRKYDKKVNTIDEQT